MTKQTIVKISHLNLPRRTNDRLRLVEQQQAHVFVRHFDRVLQQSEHVTFNVSTDCDVGAKGPNDVEDMGG